jgi:hypothetical protein
MENAHLTEMPLADPADPADPVRILATRNLRPPPRPF